jgi:Chromo (CHRromatin Organisation MOdifier) domain
VNYKQDDWVYWLPMAEFSYNNSVQATTGMTPFFAMYGRHPEIDVDLSEPTEVGLAPSARATAEEFNEIKVELALRWKEAAAAQEKHYNSRHKFRTFEKGDFVMVDSKNIKTSRFSKKLEDRYLGPFEVLEPVGRQSYRLKLTKMYEGLHRTFHVSLLEPHKSRRGVRYEAKPIEFEGNEYWLVEEILHSRVRYGKRQYLVHWTDTSPAVDSWEPAENLQELDALKEYLKKNPDVRETVKEEKKRQATLAKRATTLKRAAQQPLQSRAKRQRR